MVSWIETGRSVSAVYQSKNIDVKEFQVEEVEAELQPFPFHAHIIDMY